MTKDNKDYILNIRVSKETYENIKTKARENGESASQLIRKVLKDSGEILDDLSHDFFGSPEKNIDMYYAGTAGRASTCVKCKKDIKAGSKITIGETTFGKKHHFCTKCKK